MVSIYVTQHLFFKEPENGPVYHPVVRTGMYGCQSPPSSQGPCQMQTKSKWPKLRNGIKVMKAIKNVVWPLESNPARSQ